MVNPTINLISETHYLCKKKEYAFIILREYTIIFIPCNEATIKSIEKFVNPLLFGPPQILESIHKSPKQLTERTKQLRFIPKPKFI